MHMIWSVHQSLYMYKLAIGGLEEQSYLHLQINTFVDVYYTGIIDLHTVSCNGQCILLCPVPVCLSYVGVTIGPSYKCSSEPYDRSKELRKVCVCVCVC